MKPEKKSKRFSDLKSIKHSVQQLGVFSVFDAYMTARQFLRFYGLSNSNAT